MGLAGTLATLALYLLMVYRGYHIALHARDGFYQLLAVGLTTVLGLQTLIIVGGVTRLIPLTGITLPFISYGGSSVLVNFLIIGLLLRISSAESRPVSRSSPVQPPPYRCGRRRGSWSWLVVRGTRYRVRGTR